MTARRAILAYALLLPGLGLVTAFMALVVGMALSQSFGYFNFAGESGFSLRFWWAMLADRHLWRSVFYSLLIGTVSALISALIAYPLALWLRTPFRGSRAINAILKAPLMVPGLVAAFLYVSLIAFQGLLNLALVRLGFVAHPLRMQNDPYAIGVIVLQVWKQMPFALLLLSGAVRTIGDDILDAARDLGAGRMRRVVKIVLPLTLRALQASLAIIFIGAAGDYSFQVVVGPTGVDSMAQFLYRTQEAGVEGWNRAAVVAILLMLLSLLGSACLAFAASRAVKWVQR